MSPDTPDGGEASAPRDGAGDTPRPDIEERSRLERPTFDRLIVPSGAEAPAPGSREPEIPSQIGSYRILGLLGEGAMGVVYEAEQPTPRRKVALKVVRLPAMTEKCLRRFEHEVEILGRLQHPGIARIYEACLHRSRQGAEPFFAMELVRGRRLTEFVEDENLSTSERLRLFVGICEAVHHAHQKGVIHRDLKPGNILVDGAGQPKILDFGIARATDSDVRLTTTYTGVGQLVGTLPYMSPEQVAGSSTDLDIRSDVYALGVLLYELLSGRLPHDVQNKQPHEAARAIREDEPTPLSSGRRVFRGDLDTIVGKALEKDRERRYPSALELAADVERFLRSEPVRARPPALLYRMRRFAARNRVLVTGAAGVFLSLTIGLLVAISFSIESRRNEREAVRYRQDAEQAAAGLLQLSDLKTLRDLEARAEQLWPAHPDKIQAMEKWLSEADALAANLDVHVAALERLQKVPARAGVVAGDGFETDLERAWWTETLAGLIRDLRRFLDPDPLTGTRSSVQRRLASARSIRQRSIGVHAAAWREAVRGIAAAEAYGGLEIAPQLGLVPLGPDSVSGLWEFWHVETGERPERDPQTDTLRITGQSGVVLVLLPGGTFWMGAQNSDPEGQNYDPQAFRREQPVHEVTLAPFFLSKFELTQGQWQRWTGSDQAYYWSQERDRPMENMSWHDFTRVLQQMGLLVPTEAQWEYAARAGTGTPWWTGAERESLAGGANLADRFARANGGSEGWTYEPWLYDGYLEHAPVGTFRANRFGLHDVHGNVLEWCRDSRPPYNQRHAPGDGLFVDYESPRRVCRGGSFALGAGDARSARRTITVPETRSDDIGVRPARPLDPGPVPPRQ